MPGQTPKQLLYRELADQHGGMIARLAAACEHHPATRQDLEQDIHLHLWRSLSIFAHQCSLRTWTYRVAHNVCARHVERAMRSRPAQGWVDIDAVEPADVRADPEAATGAVLTLERLYQLIARLRPTDRHLVLLYLEGEDAASIADITAMSPGAVATRIHRIKALLAQGFELEALP